MSDDDKLPQISVDEELTCITDGEGWYTIERAVHDGRIWFEPLVIDGEVMGSSVCMSRRITNADVEGSGTEMRAIAAIIRAGRGSAHFKRCAVEFQGPHHVLLWSPRNSMNVACVPLVHAMALRDLILETVPK